MSSLFEGCQSLTYINLSNFKTEINVNIRNMFYGCNSLLKCNIITNDNKILQLFQ